MRSVCRLIFVNGIKPWSIKVKNVKIPNKKHRNDDNIIQLKFLIILNIFNN